MSTINLTQQELDNLVDLKNQGKLSQAWTVLGQKGDAYGFVADHLLSENTNKFSPGGMFLEMERVNWKNYGVGKDRGVWGGDTYNGVQQERLGNYLDFLSENKVEGGYTLPNTAEIDSFHRSALLSYGIQPQAAVEAHLSVLDNALGETESGLRYGLSWGQRMSSISSQLGGPAWEEDRIVFKSDVYNKDLGTGEAGLAMGNIAFDLIDESGVSSVLKGHADMIYKGVQVVDAVTEYLAVDTANHFAAQVALTTLDQSISKENREAILDYANNGDRAAIGDLVDRLGNVIGTGLASSQSDSAKTNLFDNIKGLTDWSRQNNMPLSIEPVDPQTTLSKALGSGPDALAHRYALAQLDPFVVTGGDKLYAQHNRQNELGIDNLSKQYLTDRAEMLRVKLQYGATNTGYSSEINSSSVEGNWDYTDLNRRIDGKNSELKVDGKGMSMSDHQVVFGSDRDEKISGSGDTDHLYGGAGEDIINGKSGNDYLEGNQGNDKLIGGKGDDILKGGQGNDKLIGGEGYNVLMGGQGDDTYQIQSGENSYNSITDSDGQGRINYDGSTLTGGRQTEKGGNHYESDDKKYSYTMEGDDDGKRILMIKTPDGNIRVNDFKNGDLGLNFNQLAEQPDPKNPTDIQMPNENFSLGGKSLELKTQPLDLKQDKEPSTDSDNLAP